MSRIRRNVIIALTGISFAACGGGSSGDDDVNFSGNWSGSLTVARDTCTVNPTATTRLLENEPSVISIAHQVSQNQGAIQLLDSTGVEFLGNVVGEDGFSVDAISRAGMDSVTGAQCEVSERINYNSVVASDDTSAEVTITRSEACSDGFTCAIEYSGAVTRLPGSIAPEPQPEDEPFRGCIDLQELNFSGDGGCGINSADVDVNTDASGTQIILISQFGENGATTFTPTASDPSVAVAGNSNLVIGESMTVADMGDEMDMSMDEGDLMEMMSDNAGYSCSITCDNSLTFLLSCFQENGNTCEERF